MADNNLTVTVTNAEGHSLTVETRGVVRMDRFLIYDAGTRLTVRTMISQERGEWTKEYLL